jgi:hypothetical protein
VLTSKCTQGNPLPVKDKRFSSSWEFRSSVPHADTQAGLASIRAKLSNPLWTDAEIACLGKVPIVDATVADVRARVLKSLPGYPASSAGARLQAVLSRTAMAFQPDDSFNLFPVESADGSPAKPDAMTLASRCVMLLRVSGIASRLAGGYKYPMLDDEEKSSLALADCHHSWWPEVFRETVGWVPLVLPMEGDDSAPPPPNLSAVEEMLANSLDTELSVESAQTIPHLPAIPVIPAVLVSVGLAIAPSVWILLGAPLLCLKRNRPGNVLRASAGLLSLHGQRREFGEDREAFAARLPSALGAGQLEVARAFFRVKYGGDDEYPPKAASLLMPLFRLLARTLPVGLACCLRGKIFHGILWYIRLSNPWYLLKADKPSSENTNANTPQAS